MIRIIHKGGSTTVESFDKLELTLSIFSPKSSIHDPRIVGNLRHLHGLVLTLKVYSNQLFEKDHVDYFYGSLNGAFTYSEVDALIKLKESICSLHNECVLIDLLRAEFRILEDCK